MPFPVLPSLTGSRVLTGTLLPALLAVLLVAPSGAIGHLRGADKPEKPAVAKTRPAPAPRAVVRRAAPVASRADVRRVQSARKLGCKKPYVALRAARRAHIPYYVGCAFLQQETGGGRNVFGHDASIFSGAGTVTKAKYLRYKKERKATGEMQGVGPMQLTWYTFQDQADRLGGAWKPYVNMLVGFRLVANLRRGTGSWHDAARAYNGTGPMADAYAAQMSHRFDVGRRIMGS
jgi:hypothetical protein